MPTISLPHKHSAAEDTQEAEARLRALLDATVDAIVTIDQHGIIESVNPATERMFGYTAEELLGSNVSMLMGSPHRGDHDHYLQRYLMTGERRIMGIGREVEARRKDGTMFPVDLAVTEFEVRGERRFTGLVRDISDRRAAERAAQLRLDELAHAGRLSDLGLTTSTIAHEVNQPLAAIVSFAHACQRMLDGGKVDFDLMRDALSQIATQGERASAIISRIRAMSRKREPLYETVSLNDAVGSVLNLLGRQLRYQKVEVSEDLAPDLPKANADRVQLEQVVMNLVINAIDAMRAVPSTDRHLAFTTRKVDGEVRLSVTDTGPGLEADEVDRVFDSFYTTKANGMGVGLSICRGLMQAHGGRLWAECRPGEGATFWVALPVDQ